jgi:hypothetical protein
MLLTSLFKRCGTNEAGEFNDILKDIIPKE